MVVQLSVGSPVSGDGQQEGQEDKESLRLCLHEHCGNQTDVLPLSSHLPLPASICSIAVPGSTHRWDQREQLRNAAVAQQLPVPRGTQRK